MKRLLVRTGLGRLLMGFRGKMELVRAAWGCGENVGTLANDKLATDLITRLCQGNKRFIDVGAHIGSVVSGVLGRDGTIRCIAVEAIPDKARHLRQKFPTVEVHECAVGESEGEVSFFINMRQSGYSSLSRPREIDGKAFVEIRVPMKRLDSVVEAEGIDAIKIDVEGAELGVLRGCPQILSVSRPTIMFESGPPGDGEDMKGKERLWELFRAHDYRLLVPNRVPHIDPGMSQEGFCESHMYPRRTTNYFAVAAERREEIRERARKVLGMGG